MLGDMRNTCWRMPARDEPCSCSISWRFLVVELILAWDDWKLAGLRVVLCRMDCVWKHCSSLLNLSWNEDWSSLLGSSLSSFLENNSVHRIIVLVWMTGLYVECMWIRPYVLLVEEMQIQPLFWHHVELLVNKPLLNVIEMQFQMKQTWMYVCILEEFILVDIWMHCCTKLELNMHWKCCSLYTLATIEEKGWDNSQMYNWHNVVNRITMKWEPVTYEN